MTIFLFLVILATSPGCLLPWIPDLVFCKPTLDGQQTKLPLPLTQIWYHKHQTGVIECLPACYQRSYKQQEKVGILSKKTFAGEPVNKKFIKEENPNSLAVKHNNNCNKMVISCREIHKNKETKPKSFHTQQGDHLLFRRNFWKRMKQKIIRQNLSQGNEETSNNKPYQNYA